VLPEEPDNIDQRLGRWIKDHLQKRRNTIRFLLPRFGSTNAFLDRDLLILARAEMKAQEWSGQNPEYKKLHTEFQGALRDILKKRFDRFAVLHRWNFADPNQCVFSVESLKSKGSDSRRHRGGADQRPVRARGLRGPRARSCARQLGGRQAAARAARASPCWPGLHPLAWRNRDEGTHPALCARGKIAINLRGMEYLQTQPGEDEDTAWRRLRPKLSLTGRHLDEVFVMLPSAVPATGGTTPAAPQPPTGGW
jgi:hypothetical protein